MPFVEIDVNQTINDILDSDAELKQMWNESRTEYAVLGELVKLRKAQGLSQVELAEKTGNKQQVISRIENKENSPTLKTLCGILDVLNYDIQFVPRVQV
ncbi:MAG: helix-turn-helix transcriptional regulator [Oscillospiraceae bacterium]|nr:helix-turn-helix transcriptional regulator [Oscillospiraceae bacterium]